MEKNKPEKFFYNETDNFFVNENAELIWEVDGKATVVLSSAFDVHIGSNDSNIVMAFYLFKACENWEALMTPSSEKEEAILPQFSQQAVRSPIYKENIQAVNNAKTSRIEI